MSEFEFIKMNGLGNDFVIIDQRSNELDYSSTEIQHICNRDKGICLLYTSDAADE